MIWYIHGANASPTSFNYLKSMLPAHEFRDFAYDCDTPLSKTIDTFVDLMNDEPSPPSIISHSLGGVIALSSSKRAKIDNHRVNLNHYEVLLCNDVVQKITDYLFVPQLSFTSLAEAFNNIPAA